MLEALPAGTPITMLHVLLRIIVWVLVLGGAYLVFGPTVFDSSPEPSPFASDSPLFLPPAKTQREYELEQAGNGRALDDDEAAEYRELREQRQARFWQRGGTTVEEALAGIRTERKSALARILGERGLTREEVAIYLFVVERDRPALLTDREQAR